MFSIKKKMVVPYTTEQMFILINDIVSYPDFIPGCVDSRVLMGDDFKLVAKIDFFRFGISHSFVTQNVMIKNQRIFVKLVYGPLKSLFGFWKFTYLTKCATEVECNFSYKFQSILTEKMFNYVIKKVVNDTINSFIFRANEIYR